MLVVHIKQIRRLVLLAAGAVIAAILLFALAGCLGKGHGPKPQPIPAATAEERMAYLTELGWQAEPDPVETLHLALPRELSGQYGDYTALQEKQGLPFSSFAGKTVERYTYALTNYPGYDGPVQANLYVCDGQLIGGDVTAPGENGFIRELAFPQ